MKNENHIKPYKSSEAQESLAGLWYDYQKPIKTAHIVLWSKPDWNKTE
jgi:hypothetical protein